MKIDDTVLLAYVDGDLPAERRAEVEAAAAHSTDLAQRLAAMQASVLPYGAAFDRQVLPPVPPQLAKRVAELARVSVNARATLRGGSSMRWLAAAFFAGVLSCGAVLKLSSGNFQGLLTASAPAWIKAVADYQTLYTRQTLADVNEDRALSQKVLGEVRQVDGMAVHIPDLRGAGLAFKRVQRLKFHDQPVVQIVYLPERGDPIALCVTQDSRPDEAPRAQQVGDMGAVVWRRDRLGYVLLGKRSTVELSELGRHIASGDEANLARREPAARHFDLDPA